MADWAGHRALGWPETVVPQASVSSRGCLASRSAQPCTKKMSVVQQAVEQRAAPFWGWTNARTDTKPFFLSSWLKSGLVPGSLEPVRWLENTYNQPLLQGGRQPVWSPGTAKAQTLKEPGHLS